MASELNAPIRAPSNGGPVQLSGNKPGATSVRDATTFNRWKIAGSTSGEPSISLTRTAQQIDFSLPYAPAAATRLETRSSSVVFKAAAGSVDALPAFPLGTPWRYKNIEPFGAASDFQAVAVRDLNGDHRMDVVARSLWDLYVFIQSPSGSLEAPVIWPMSESTGYVPPTELLVEDFNEDGVSDVLTTGMKLLPWGSAERTGLAFLSGNGVLSRRQVFTSADFPGGNWSAIDVDQDGHMDVIGSATEQDFTGTDCGFAQYCPRLKLLHGDGQGNFERPETIRLGIAYNISSLIGTDLDLDGRRDLSFLLTGFPGTPGRVVAMYQLDKGLSALVDLHASQANIAAAGIFADFNGDQKIDSLFFTGDDWKLPEVKLQDQYGAFSLAYELEAGATVNQRPLAVDIDGDGLMDVVSVELVTAYRNPVVAVNLQRAGFLQFPLLSAPDPELDNVPRLSPAMAAGDINGDRCNDVVIAASTSGIYFWPGRGCTFRAPPLPDESGGLEKYN